MIQNQFQNGNHIKYVIYSMAGVRYSIKNPAAEKINIGGFIHILEEAQKNK